MVSIREEKQANPVADPVSALVAVTRPIIAGVLQSINAESLVSYGGDRSKVPLYMLGKLRSAGDGDCGIAFEYAIHQAVRERNEVVLDRISSALAKCKITKGDPASILFAIEKQGSKQLISTESELVTPDSRVLSGKQGQPVKLMKQMNTLAAAFRRASTRANLPQSIRGLWKADLFLGSPEPDHWVGTSVKINPSHVEGAAGLRIAVVPTHAGKSDVVKLDEQRNLVMCPIPHDGSFMQTFYEGWRLTQSLCASHFTMPKEVAVPSPIEREVARIFVKRRKFTVEEVLEVTEQFAQPHLLVTDVETVSANDFSNPTSAPTTTTVVTPFPLAT